MLEGDGGPDTDGELDDDGEEPGPVDPDEPADALALPLVRAPPGVGLLPGWPVADLDRDPEPPACVRAAAADADWLACQPEPASSACCCDELPDPNGLSAITPTATSATAATAAVMMTLRLRLPGPAGGPAAASPGPASPARPGPAHPRPVRKRQARPDGARPSAALVGAVPLVVPPRPPAAAVPPW